LGTLCLALSIKKRQQLYDLLISVLSQAIVMHRDQPAEKEVLLKRKAEEEALALEQSEDEALNRQKAEEVWAKVCAQYLARRQSAEATSPKQTSIASPRTTNVDGELIETEISCVESELKALEYALQAWLLLPHCEQVQRCTHARTQRSEDLQASARFPPSTKAEEDGRKAEEEVLLNRKVEEEELARSRQVWEQAKEEALAGKKSEEEGKSEGGERRTSQSNSASGDVSCSTHVHEKQNIKTCLFSCSKIHSINKHAGHDVGGCRDLLQFCAANPLNPSTPPRNPVTNRSSERDSLEDSDIPNVADIGAGGGVVLGSVDEECAAARKEGDEQEQSSGKWGSFTQSHFPKRFSEIEVVRLSSQDAAERGGSTSSPSTPMTVDTPNTKLGGS